MKTFLIVSVILNIVLGIAMFFKSSLNEILTQWWIHKQEAKKERKKQLIEFRSKIMRLSTLSFIILMELALGGLEQNLYPKKKGSFEEWGEINTYIIHDEMYLPEGARNLYHSFSKKMGDFNFEVLTIPPSKKRIEEMSQESQLHFRQIIEILEKEISKL